MATNRPEIITKKVQYGGIGKYVYDVADFEKVDGVEVEYSFYVHKRKNLYSRNKTKMIQNGSYIPLDKIKCDQFGYAKNFKLPKKYYVSSSTIHTSFKILKPIQHVDRVYPLYMASNKYKSPCGASFEMLKNYLAHIKTNPNVFKENTIKITWMNKADFIDKIIYINESQFMNVTRKYKSKNNYRNIKRLLLINLLKSFKKNVPIFKCADRYIYRAKHLLLPFIEIKCPCEFMGCKRCSKYFNIFKMFSFYGAIIGKLTDDERIHIKDFFVWIQSVFINDVIINHLKQNNNSIHVTTSRKVFKKHCRQQVTKVTHHTLNYNICHNCGFESVNANYKKSKNQIKKFGTYQTKKCAKCSAEKCGCCGNNKESHIKTMKKRGKQITIVLKECPPLVTFEKPSDESIQEIQQALGEENVETAKCPNCDLLVTKDEACDKVMCGKIDGNQLSGGCGTKFCFRCSEDIGHLENYIDHLIVTMKSDGSNTNWICKKFAKACPTCQIKQFWDGSSDKITCGNCVVDFQVEST